MRFFCDDVALLLQKYFDKCAQFHSFISDSHMFLVVNHSRSEILYVWFGILIESESLMVSLVK